MRKIQSLNLYQKGVLAVMLVMAIAFTGVYARTISRVGFEYMDTILLPSQEKDGTVYSGQIQGQQACFTVSEDRTVAFQYGDQTYGPYTAKEDPTAIPADEEKPEEMIGVELLEGDSVLFRGGVWMIGDEYLLYDEDGGLENIRITYTTGDGIERDENGNAVDPAEPSASTILRLMNDPQLTHKGEWPAWLGGVLLCVGNALLILFADKLFRWNLRFQIRDADNAEPSDWEMASRYIGWTALTILALVLFLLGLK